MRLWAIQLEILAGPAKTDRAYPQVIVDAKDIDEARESAMERVRQENPSVLKPDQVKVRAACEIGLENIWIFNDKGFRNVGSDAPHFAAKPVLVSNSR